MIEFVTMGKRKAVLIGRTENLPYVFPRQVIDQASQIVDWVIPPEESSQFGRDVSCRDLPAETEVIFSTWGMPTLDNSFLDKLPRLEAVFYGAGSIRGFATEAAWKRGIRIFSAAQLNAVPVAEFTVAQIILGLKHLHNLRVTRASDWPAANSIKESMQGNYCSKVGLISYGAIARLVRKLLRSFEHEVWVYDPFLTPEEAEDEAVRLAGLEELFRECHAVSLHTPLLPQTRGMIRGIHFESMQKKALFINTSRGAIVNQSEMVEALFKRPDLHAVIDVLEKEPPMEGEPLLEVPNAFVTPHVAGSMGHECARMGAHIVRACRDYLEGIPSPLEVREADMASIA